MRRWRHSGLAMALGVLAGVGLLVRSAGAAAPASGPFTLGKFLGIPQTYQRVRDATANRNGNNPQRERKPPVKRIADPENLDPNTIAGKNPAINAAANVKAQEDLKEQKIKAIKYLATIGCGCYPEVKPALMAALDDCTEEVRYEAAMALCRASGNPCKVCNKSTCCDAEVMDKLAKIAHEKDANGCFKEPSPRVRAAAETALNACRAVTPPTPAPAPGPKETTPFAPEAPPAQKPAPTSASAAPVSPDGEDAMRIDAAGFTQVTDVAPEMPGPPTAAPNLIGQFFGGGEAFAGFQPVGRPSGGTGTVPIAGGDRRFEIGESNRPMPADRVFFDYDHFQNPLRDAQNQSRVLPARYPSPSPSFKKRPKKTSGLTDLLPVQNPLRADSGIVSNRAELGQLGLAK